MFLGRGAHPNLLGFLRSVLPIAEVAALSRLNGQPTSFESAILSRAMDNQADARINQLVDNYQRALEQGSFQLSKGLPVNLMLTLDLHNILFGQMGAEAGNFRETQLEPFNLLGVESATHIFTPPPVDFLKPALYSLDKFFRHPPSLPDLVIATLVYYQLVALQPFEMGSGIMAGLIFSLMTSKQGGHDGALLPLTPYIERNKEKLAKAFYEIMQNGDWAGWTGLFLDMIADQSARLVDITGRLDTLHHDYSKLLVAERASNVLPQLLDELFSLPAITVNRAARVCRVTFRAAQFNVEKLVSLGILAEHTGRRRNRVYVVPQLIELYGSI
ncbi:MAG: Fic family protein [Nitrospinae bacterium]|nr:Fic family protein [Nitrospinota bacterium]